MKARDTPILLDLLRGQPYARALVREFANDEVATTEVNLLELRAVALRGPKAQRRRREEALEGLRRRLTVLPVDPAATEAAARLAAPRPEGATVATWLMLGTLESHGCSELVTIKGAVPQGKFSFRLKFHQ
jgi:predicted nucleic acid-binding protein